MFTPIAALSKKVALTTTAAVVFDNTAGGVQDDFGNTSYSRALVIYNAGPGLAFVRTSFGGHPAVVDQDHFIAPGQIQTIYAGPGSADPSKGMSVSMVSASTSLVHLSMGSGDISGSGPVAA